MKSVAVDYAVSALLPQKARPFYVGARMAHRHLSEKKQQRAAAADTRQAAQSAGASQPVQVVRPHNGRGAPTGVYDPIRGRAIYYMAPDHTKGMLRKALEGEMTIEKSLQECGVLAGNHPQFVARLAAQREELERLMDAGDKRRYRKARRAMVKEAEAMAVRNRDPRATSFTFKFT